MLIIGVAVLKKCPKYECKHPANPEDHEVCTLLINDFYGEELAYIGNCEIPGQVCSFDPNTPSGGKCRNNLETVAYPGEKAKNYRTCIGPTINGYCRGKPVGEQCYHNQECDIGLYCSGVCSVTKKLGESCLWSYHCASYLLCHNEICVDLGSIKNGEQGLADHPELCESKYMVNGFCAEGPKLLGRILVDDNEVMCQYSNGEIRPASCTHHSDGKAVCMPGEGDTKAEWEIILSYMKMQPQCSYHANTYGICDYGEKEFGKAYHRAVIALFRTDYMHKIQSPPECLKNDLVPDYYESLQKYNGATYISVLAGLIIAILLLI